MKSHCVSVACPAACLRLLVLCSLSLATLSLLSLLTSSLQCIKFTASSGLWTCCSSGQCPPTGLPTAVSSQGHSSLRPQANIASPGSSLHVSLSHRRVPVLPHLPLPEMACLLLCPLAGAPEGKHQEAGISPCCPHGAHGLQCSEQRKASRPHPPPLSKPCQVPEAPFLAVSALPEGLAHSIDGHNGPRF